MGGRGYTILHFPKLETRLYAQLAAPRRVTSMRFANPAKPA